MAWTEPKTNWTEEDAFDYRQYNRVVDNIVHLKTLADDLFAQLTHLSLEQDKNNLSHIYARHMNAIESGLHTLNAETYKKDIGEIKTYKANTRVPDYHEYNRIETACLMLYIELQVHKANLPRLALTLGQKGLKV